MVKIIPVGVKNQIKRAGDWLDRNKGVIFRRLWELVMIAAKAAAEWYFKK